jgi:hypothetical protein
MASCSLPYSSSSTKMHTDTSSEASPSGVLPQQQTDRDASKTVSEELSRDLLFAATDILKQCRDMIASLPSADSYTAISMYVPGSTIGKHVRHLCDHFRLLLEALQAPDTNQSDSMPAINYDRREREVGHADILASIRADCAVGCFDNRHALRLSHQQRWHTSIQ